MGHVLAEPSAQRISRQSGSGEQHYIEHPLCPQPSISNTDHRDLNNPR